MHTAFCLMARHNAQVVIPVNAVVKDYFSHLRIDKFIRKVTLGDINIPLIRIEAGNQKKSPRACTASALTPADRATKGRNHG